MIKLKEIAGYYAKEEEKGIIQIEYFIFGPKKRIYFSKQFSLLDKIASNSFDYQDLFFKLEKNIEFIKFESFKISMIKEYNNPEILPHLNNKFMGCILILKNKKIPIHLFSIENSNTEILEKFLKNYDNNSFDLKKIINPEYNLNLKNENNYKEKMKLILNKIENDEKNNFKIEDKFIVDNENLKEEKESFVKLNTGSHYSGNIKDNKPNGKGKEFLENQVSYVGDFKDGNWEGIGYLADNENCMCYGEFYKGNIIGI